MLLMARYLGTGCFCDAENLSSGINICINNWIQVLIRDNLSGKSKIKGTLVFLSQQFCLPSAV